MLHNARETTPKDVLYGVGITGIIFLVAGYIPAFGIAWLFMLPLSIFYYRMRLGRGQGALVMGVVSAIALAAWGGFTPDVGLGLGLLLLGFMLGEFSEKGLAVELTILYSAGLVFACGLVALLFYSTMSGTGVDAVLSSYVAKNLEMSVKFYQDAGMAADRLQELIDSMDTLKRVMVGIFPGLAATVVILAAWLTMLAARPIMMARGIAFPYSGSLNRWVAPDHLVWGVIGCGALVLISDGPPERLALNLLIVLGAVYFFQGIAVISFFLEKKNAPRPLRIAVYGMMIIWQALLPAVSVLGLFDIWADFRKLRTVPGDGRDNNNE